MVFARKPGLALPRDKGGLSRAMAEMTENSSIAAA
jgi:hypothetical protein